VLSEMFALELDYMSDQQFSIRIGHSDEAAMETIRVERVGDGINTQHSPPPNQVILWTYIVCTVRKENI